MHKLRNWNTGGRRGRVLARSGLALVQSHSVHTDASSSSSRRARCAQAEHVPVSRRIRCVGLSFVSPSDWNMFFNNASARPAVTLSRITENKRLKSKSQNERLKSNVLMFTCVEFARRTGNCRTKLNTGRETWTQLQGHSQETPSPAFYLNATRGRQILPVLQKSEEPMTSDLCSFWVILNKSSSL